MYPSGSWIENEMKDQTTEGFAMKGVPAFTVTADSAMPATALHSGAGEPYIVPSDAANVAGGKELLRIMLSTDAATNFTKTKLAPTIVSGLVPADGFGSTALVSQTEMLDAAGDDIFNFFYWDTYGMNQDELPLWNSFLAGDMSVEDLTSAMQDLADNVREDDTSPRSRWCDRPDHDSEPGPPQGGPGRPSRPEADVRLRQLHVRVPRRPGRRRAGVRGVAVHPGGLLLPDRLDRFQADVQLHRPRQLPLAVARRHLPQVVQEQPDHGHRHPARDDRHRPHLRLVDHDRRLQPRAAARHPQLEPLPSGVVLPVRGAGHRDRADLEQDLRPVQRIAQRRAHQARTQRLRGLRLAR